MFPSLCLSVCLCFCISVSVSVYLCASDWTVRGYSNVHVVIQGIGVVLPVENKMKTPKAFGGWFGVIDLAMTVAMVLYAAMGFYGYLRFGDTVQGSITLNLPCHQVYVHISLDLSAILLHCPHR